MDRQYIIMGNGYGWCKYTHAIANKLENVRYIDDYLPVYGSMKKKLVHLHYSTMVNKVIDLPLKQIWYNEFFKTIGLSDCLETVLIIYDNNKLCNDSFFLTAVKKRYPRTIMVYMFTNIVAKSRAIENNFVNNLKKYYDMVFAFDKTDAVKYDFYYSPLVYSPDKFEGTKKQNKEKECVFYIGNAKDRLEMLHAVYNRIRSLGFDFKCFIVGVPVEKQKYKGSIIYNKVLPYNTVLNYIQNATCLLDVIQGESTGLTIKVCEALYFKKKLITTNMDIVHYDFYDDRFIKVIESEDDITEDFLGQDLNVTYKESGREYFSLHSLIQRINDIIDNTNGNESK